MADADNATPVAAPDSAFLERVERYLDGALDDADLERLRGDLLANPSAVDTLVDVAMMRGWLAERLAACDALPAASAQTGPTGAETESGRVNRNGSRGRSPATLRALSLMEGERPREPRPNVAPVWNSPWLRRAAAAAIFLGVAALSATVVLYARRPAGEYVAGAGDVWADGLRFAVGDRLPRGPLDLERGFAQVRIHRRAMLLVESPARFELSSRDRVMLMRGKLTVRTAPGRRLAVWTPTAHVADIGTEFGVGVAEDGASVVHVFEGAVDVAPRIGRAAGGPAVRVLATQGAAVGTGGVQRAALAAAFRRSLPPDTPSASSSLPRGVAAWWRFEDEVPPPSPNRKDLDCQPGVIPDDSGCSNALSWWPGALAGGIGACRVSREIPPPWMFRSGCGGGNGSFDTRGPNPAAMGTLFHDTATHGRALCFEGSFTLEAFFKVAPGRTADDAMAIAFRDNGSKGAPAAEARSYMLGVNERDEGRPEPGAVRFSVFGTRGETGTVALADCHVADGAWHYAAARYDRATQSLSLILFDEHGRVRRQAQPLPEGFVLRRGGMHNLSVGCRSHIVPVEGRFIGLLDEIRLSGRALADRELLAPVEAPAP